MDEGDIAKLDLPEHLESKPDCVYLVNSACHHGLNPHEDRVCRKYCFLQLSTWLECNYVSLGEEGLEKMILAVAEID